MRILICLAFILFVKPLFAQTEITEKEIKDHIDFLASDKNKGRFPGTKGNWKVVKYISKQFKNAGLATIKGTYLQPFEAKLKVPKGATDTPIVKTWNVIGLIEGADSKLKEEYIVVGAHNDHLGMGGPSSKKDTIAIHHGADDNASGTAALLEIAEKLSANRKQLKRSILIISFGAEEQGLLGSKYVTNHPPVPLEKIKLMINMDMVGRLNGENQIYMGGAGTFDGGMELMKNLGPQFNLNPVVHAGEVGGSDHVSFYKKNISVLGLHTGGHPQYHTPEDVAALINIKGEKRVCDYIYSAIFYMATVDRPITFIKQN
ncbi:M20/M25/M40 family metallo-hydrolase [Chitinophagaceae bacterium LB-8]|uniref:M20/M25/M40 family metallo-hydrolase n=1 Tax=Paraflavisolibacter caeni TaxID=2982496 RepID=A0A9X2XPU5_9BACT|nr:M20/M25/M40 family metallo-hydrolase [Paraflavisolibacter caeni]MCU7551834.1 M20/M25/M40 family metallo-hydrolase [Paraflavisolibacter caeni]